MTDFAITPGQHELLAFIKSYIVEKGGIAPTLEEMRAHMAVGSKSIIHRHLVALEQRGHIVRKPRLTRCISVPSHNVMDALRAASDEALRDELTRRGWEVVPMAMAA